MNTRQDTVERFRNRLIEVIARTGLSRAAFARKVGIDRSTLAQILATHTDRLPRVETLAAIATSEQVSIDWLVGLTEEGRLDADVVRQTLEIERGGLSPSDEHLERWHAEAIGYKIRHVPMRLPDLLKTAEVIQHEYQTSVITTPQTRQEISEARLAYQRRPETDMEVCTSVSSLRALALGQEDWSGLSAKIRRAQMERIADLTQELYPTFRWFLYDGLKRYSVPLTVFGPKRAVIYVGDMYFVLNGRFHISVLTEHFDQLIRSAVVQPTEIADFAGELLASIR